LKRKKFLPDDEFNDVVKSSYERIWKFKGKENQNWEDRIFNTYSYLSKKHKTFSKMVTQDDYWDVINRLYHDELSSNQFKEKIVRNLCKIETFVFYFEIPRLYNFNKNISLGKCQCYSFSEIPKRVRNEFIDWAILGLPDQSDEAKKDRIEYLSQFLVIKLIVRGIGFDKALVDAQEEVEQNLNILRYIFEEDIQPRLIIAENYDRHIVDGPFGNWSQHIETNWALGRFEDYFEDEINFLSKIFKKKSSTDLEVRIKQAVNMFGVSLTISYLPLQLIALCSGLESLVVIKPRNIGKQISSRISDILNEENYNKTKNDLATLYKKRNTSIHIPTKEYISKDDVKLCLNYLKKSIKKITSLRNEGFTALDSNKSKSLFSKFDWKTN